MAKRSLVPLEPIERAILVVRGHKVILDSELAALYEVTTKRFNEQVKRNSVRFPPDFMFQLTREEFAALRSQIATSSSVPHGGRRYLPRVFTEHGALMAASVLNSPRAVEMSVFVVRAFIRLRDLARTHTELAAKLTALERKVAGHDEDLKQMFAALRALIDPPTRPRRSIGFWKQ